MSMADTAIYSAYNQYSYVPCLQQDTANKVAVAVDSAYSNIYCGQGG